LPAWTATSSRPQIRTTPLLSSWTYGTGGTGSAAIASSAACFGPDRVASLDHPGSIESAIALTVTCCGSSPVRPDTKLANAPGKRYVIVLENAMLE
jgi:hypothetical protein